MALPSMPQSVFAVEILITNTTMSGKESVKELVTSTELTAEQSSKLAQLIEAVPEILKKTDNPDYDEIFGYRINADDVEYVDVGVRNEILLKFLIANEYDVAVTKDKVKATLNWRNKFRPLYAAYAEQFDQELDDLGAVVKVKAAKPNLNVSTWNFYGALKSPKKLFQTFGDADDGALPGSPFLRWRVGLMERSLSLVDFTSIDNHKVAQVHDYNGVSMFRIDPGMKAATKEIIQVFGDNYPELLSTKFFVNVPSLMGWVFTFFKTIGIISEATLKKFQVFNHGDLGEFFGSANLPKVYNGNKTTEITSLFDTQSALQFSVPAYGEQILKKDTEKASAKAIEQSNLEVE